MDGVRGGFLQEQAASCFSLGEKQEVRIGFCLFTYLLKTEKEDFPSGPGKDPEFPVQVAGVGSLVREQDPTCWS